MTQIRIRDAAALLGVSDDTVRRWVDQGTLESEYDSSNRKVIKGSDLARYLREQPSLIPVGLSESTSARNRLVGLVTNVISDKVMSQVEMQCGPFRVVSLMSTEAVRELRLEEGVVAVAVIKATNVIVDVRKN